MMRKSRRTTFVNLRAPAVAGLFYPSDPDELRTMVEGFMKERGDAAATSFKAFILPHAGYIYSGSIAAVGYQALQADRSSVDRIVLLGPSHRVAFRGLASSSHDAFTTPLGNVPVDRASIEGIGDLLQVAEMDRAHAQEHSLEVHLPFLQVALGDVRLVPLLVGDAEEGQVAEVLNRLWGGLETRIIISSDLSHYHSYRAAAALDRETARRIESLQPVVPDQACGAVPLDGLLQVARVRKLKVQTLDLRNSGDTAGPRDQVVGYGAFAAA